MTLLFFLPVMFAFSPLLTFDRPGVLRADRGLAARRCCRPLRKANAKVIEAQTARGSFLYQNLAGMRTVKSLALETPPDAANGTFWWRGVAKATDEKVMAFGRSSRRACGRSSGSPSPAPMPSASIWR